MHRLIIKYIFFLLISLNLFAADCKTSVEAYLKIIAGAQRANTKDDMLQLLAEQKKILGDDHESVLLLLEALNRSGKENLVPDELKRLQALARGEIPELPPVSATQFDSQLRETTSAVAELKRNKPNMKGINELEEALNGVRRGSDSAAQQSVKALEQAYNDVFYDLVANGEPEDLVALLASRTSSVDPVPLASVHINIINRYNPARGRQLLDGVVNGLVAQGKTREAFVLLGHSASASPEDLLTFFTRHRQAILNTTDPHEFSRIIHSLVRANVDHNEIIALLKTKPHSRRLLSDYANALSSKSKYAEAGEAFSENGEKLNAAISFERALGNLNFQRAATLYEELGDKLKTAQCLEKAGGELELERALDLYLEVEGPVGVPRCLERVGGTANLQRAADMFRSLEDPVSAARCLQKIGGEHHLERAANLFAEGSDYQAAKRIYQDLGMTEKVQEMEERILGVSIVFTENPRPASWRAGTINVATLRKSRQTTEEALQRISGENPAIRFQEMNKPSHQYRTTFDVDLAQNPNFENLSESNRALLRAETRKYELTIVDGVTPSTLPPSHDIPFYRHPEFLKYYQELRNVRPPYKIVIDSSLDVPGCGAGAACDSGTRELIMRQNSSWRDFVHEFQHFKFNQIVESVSYQDIVNAPGWLDLTRNARRTRIRRVLAEGLGVPENKVASEMVDQAEAMAALSRRGLPKTAVNETLATEAERAMMRRYGVRTNSPDYLIPRRYALQWQVFELEKKARDVGLTIREKAMLQIARSRYAIIAARLGPNYPSTPRITKPGMRNVAAFGATTALVVSTTGSYTACQLILEGGKIRIPINGVTDEDVDRAVDDCLNQADTCLGENPQEE